MFEHKPPFIDAHAAQVARISGSEMICAHGQRISALDRAWSACKLRPAKRGSADCVLSFTISGT